MFSNESKEKIAQRHSLRPKTNMKMLGLIINTITEDRGPQLK